MPGHDDTITSAFTAQAAGFNAGPAQNARVILDALIELAAPQPSQTWLEAACGPGIVSRALAPHVAAVHGFDLTPAMVQLARAEAARVGADNARFDVGDAAELPVGDDSVDGALTRWSLHHIPAPGRVISELARVVRPGGRIVVVDHLADEDRDAFAWAAEIERLRDPAHWASLTPAALRGLGEAVGLTLAEERVLTLTLQFDEWLARGTSDPAVQSLVNAVAAQRPHGTERFTLAERDRARTITLQMWLGAWRA